VSEMAERLLAETAHAAAEAAAAAMTGGARSAAELLTRAGDESAFGGLVREAGEAGPAAAGPAESAARELQDAVPVDQVQTRRSGLADLIEAAGSESGFGAASQEPGERGPAGLGLEPFDAIAGVLDIDPVPAIGTSDSAGEAGKDAGSGGDSADDSDTGASDNGAEGEPRAAFPGWLRQILETCVPLAADHIPLNATSMRFDEVRLAGDLVLGSFAPNNEIVKRENSQLAELEPDAARACIDAFQRMYGIGEMILDTLANRAAGIGGDSLAGRHVLELPPQAGPIPAEVLRYAASYEIIIRDTNGKVYS
jgi:hypothetical protein